MVSYHCQRYNKGGGGSGEQILALKNLWSTFVRAKNIFLCFLKLVKQIGCLVVIIKLPSGSYFKGSCSYERRTELLLHNSLTRKKSQLTKEFIQITLYISSRIKKEVSWDTRWSKKSALFCFSSQSCALQFFSIFFRWCRKQAWEILLTPIWIQLDAILRSSG